MVPTGHRHTNSLHRSNDGMQRHGVSGVRKGSGTVGAVEQAPRFLPKRDSPKECGIELIKDASYLDNRVLVVFPIGTRGTAYKDIWRTKACFESKQGISRSIERHPELIAVFLKGKFRTINRSSVKRV